MDGLVERIAQAASERDERLEVLVPYRRGDLVSLAHERCRSILEESHEEDGTRITMLAGPAYAALFGDFVV